MRVTMSLANTAYNLADLLSAPEPPVAALAGAGAGNVDNGAHKYLVTFVTATGESAGGAVSAAVTVVDKTADGKVALTAIPLGPTGTVSRNIYRTVAAGTVYKLQSNIANNTATTLTDNTADASLTTVAPATASRYDTKPPFYSDLILSGLSTNGGIVYYEIGANPNFSATNAAGAIGTTGSARIEGRSPVAPGDIWLLAATAGDKLLVSGHPF